VCMLWSQEGDVVNGNSLGMEFDGRRDLEAER